MTLTSVSAWLVSFQCKSGAVIQKDATVLSGYGPDKIFPSRGVHHLNFKYPGCERVRAKIIGANFLNCLQAPVLTTAKACASFFFSITGAPFCSGASL